ncbi:putative lysophosphatidic acid:oleoyl-CoA acyltransferase [Escovopsis weberi]|uniref:Putative lysophosphatidic acid:oleoyl-CoA acyltransferase n=1 Tax=Escovopsis weberi TaxID=150374 RepID=A0A0M8MVZ2_ESCWE|nr:putative lysophosphatidic acid:oleoyl-CoA acyltransferase [Escovopsis weberi]
MEKYSQYRDRATGIAPFLPVSTPPSAVTTLTHGLLFCVRLPLFLTYVASYLLFFHWLPLPVFVRKIALWGMMAIPGIWWVDLQLDGVKRGTLSEQPRERVPHPGSVIAANFTSPIDAVYLAAVFDPVFTQSFPGTRKVRQIGLVRAALMALAPVRAAPPPHPRPGELVTLAELLERNPDRVVAVFPECGTTNGKAILPLAHSLLPTPPDVHIFPVSIRYTPPDVTTPIPGRWAHFLWNLLSRPTTCVRVRIAGSQGNTATAQTNGTGGQGLVYRGGGGGDDDVDDGVTLDEQRLLDMVGEALARLSRVKRVSLTMREKADFVRVWNGKKA